MDLLLVGVLDAGMSSRLFKKLRDEMGVCYYVSAGHDAFTDHGLFCGERWSRQLKALKKWYYCVILGELKKLKR
jgi:hypothetical protein